MAVNRNNIVLCTDVTEYETDVSCGMKLWLSKYEQGCGVIPKGDHLPTRVLQETHEDMRTIAKMEDISREAIQAAIDPILAKLTDQQRENTRMMEILYRRLGWFAAFALFMEPALRDMYETIEHDPWMVLDRDPLWVTTEPDRIMRNKVNGDIVYHEYIPTTFSTSRWLEVWEREIRLQVGMGAARESVNIQPAYGQIRAFSKGFHGAHGRLIHPYVYGKFNKASGAWNYSQYSTTLKEDGVIDKPVWEFNGGIVQWVLNCGGDTARMQFSLSARIFPKPRALADWLAQRLNRERQIRTVKEQAQTNQHIRNLYFVKNPRACKPMYGEECPYVQACWEMGGIDLLKSGRFLPMIMPTGKAIQAEVRT